FIYLFFFFKKKKAVEYFEEARNLEVGRVKDMDYYSTSLWYLKDEAKLYCLASEMMEIARHEAITWFIQGNAYSIKGDHERALTCFKRATQINDQYAYAYTMIGHESLLIGR